MRKPPQSGSSQSGATPAPVGKLRPPSRRVRLVLSLVVVEAADLSHGMLADGAQALLEVTPRDERTLYLVAGLSMNDQLGLLEFADEMLCEFAHQRDAWEDDGRGGYRTWLSLEWVEGQQVA